MPEFLLNYRCRFIPIQLDHSLEYSRNESNCRFKTLDIGRLCQCQYLVEVCCIFVSTVPRHRSALPIYVKPLQDAAWHVVVIKHDYGVVPLAHHLRFKVTT